MFQSSSFGVIVLKRDNKETSRFGFVVSTKVSKRAVKRNKLKRMFRSAVVSQLSNIKANYDLVFLVKKSALDKDQNDINKEVETMFKRTRLI